MTPPAKEVPPIDTDALRSAHWQGVMGTKLDQVIEEVRRMNDGKEAEHAKINARIDVEITRVDDRIDRVAERTDSLESTRDRAMGALFGAAAIGGVLGGGVSSLITFLVT